MAKSVAWLITETLKCLNYGAEHLAEHWKIKRTFILHITYIIVVYTIHTTNFDQLHISFRPLEQFNLSIK